MNFNEYCYSVCPDLFRYSEEHKKWLFTEKNGFLKHFAGPYDSLGQMSHVVQALIARTEINKPMWNECVWGEKLYSGKSIKEICREFIESTMDE